MTEYIAHLTGATGSELATGPRIVRVNPWALALFKRAGITPPDGAGQFLDVADVDAKLAAAGLGITERMEAKGHLTKAGLLPAGKRVNTVRP